MGNITKKDAIRIVVDCAEKYKDNLADRTLLFILSDKHKNTSILEVTFNASNFFHLTGLKIPNLAEKDNDSAEVRDSDMLTTKAISPTEFYRRCLKHELSEKDFEFADNGTTEMKLSVLPTMMTANLGAKSVGIYNKSKPRLYTEKLAGGVNGCMGFCKD